HQQTEKARTTRPASHFPNGQTAKPGVARMKRAREKTLPRTEWPAAAFSPGGSGPFGRQRRSRSAQEDVRRPFLVPHAGLTAVTRFFRNRPAARPFGRKEKKRFALLETRTRKGEERC